jgi:hypothetical protein
VIIIISFLYLCTPEVNKSNMNENIKLEDWLENRKWFHFLITGWLTIVTLVIWYLLYLEDKIDLISGFNLKLIVIVLIGLLVLFFVGLVVFFMGYLALKIAINLADSLPNKLGYIIKTLIAILLFVLCTAILLSVGPNRFDMVGRF